MKIYTRTGDSGETGLINGNRIKKSDFRIIAYGSVDELNSYLGLTISLLSGKKELFSDIVDIFISIQNELFIMGSDLANPEFNENNKQEFRINENMITKLEDIIDKYELELPSINFFILPGGSVESSYMHIARSISRRVETNIVRLSLEQIVNPLVIKYMNRLSDLLFTIARLTNNRLNINDVAWKKS